MAPFARRRTVLTVGAVFCLAAAAWAGGGKPGPKPKGGPAPPSHPFEKLPPGCVRLIDADTAALAPDGRRIAFGRGAIEALPIISRPGKPPDLFVRDLKTQVETSLLVHSAPVAWTADGAILLEAGYGVDSRGAVLSRIAALPSAGTAIECAWTRDGKRLAYVPRGKPKAKTAVSVLPGPGKTSTLAGTQGLVADQAAFLAWSPSGDRLYVNALFQEGDGVPMRRVGIVDVAGGAMKTLATMPDWIEIPGLHGGYGLRYRDPRVEKKDVDLEWTLPTAPRWGRDVWSADGRLVAWLSGTGWIEADAFVFDTASGTEFRVTNDGDAKWSPALEPSGRRLAFLMGDDVGTRGKFKNRRIRMLDLSTGEPTDFPVAGTDGVPAALSWRADGQGLLYEVHGGESPGTFSQAIPAAKAAPSGATLKTLPYDPKNRIIAWLADYDADRVHTAVHRAEDGWDDAYVPALRETLLKWKDSDTSVVPCLAHLLGRRKVTCAVPDLRAVLDAKDEGNRLAAARALVALGEADGKDLLARLVETASDEGVRLGAGLALVRAGDDRGWPPVEKATKDKSVYARRSIAGDLARIRSPRSVDLLIGMVTDRERPEYKFIKAPREASVGDVAILALRALTGKSFGGDAKAWKTWWEVEAKRVLPENVPPVDDPDGYLAD